MIPGERPLRAFLNPIAVDLVNPSVREIVVNQCHEIGIETGAGWTWRTVDDFSFERLDQIGILAGYQMAKDFDPDHPICLTTLPDGQRYTTCRPPVTAPGSISVTIRIPSQDVHTVEDDDFSDLMRAANMGGGRKIQINQELVSLYHAKDWQRFFPAATRAKKTTLATGVVGSGKTSFIKRLMQGIPLDERVVTIEDTDEFGRLPHRNRVALFYGSAGVTAEDAVQVALRMRPDRILMQELRGREAFSFMHACLTGHDGGMTTLHSGMGADAAFEALALKVQMHDQGKSLPKPELIQLLRTLVDIIVWCHRDADGFSVPYVWFRDAEESV